jgi:hypothetical protein
MTGGEGIKRFVSLDKGHKMHVLFMYFKESSKNHYGGLVYCLTLIWNRSRSELGSYPSF